MISYENEMECEWTEMCVRDISGGKEKEKSVGKTKQTNNNKHIKEKNIRTTARATWHKRYSIL